MSAFTIGLVGIAVLFALLALRTPVGFAMAAVGLGGITILQNERAALATFSTETFELALKLDLIIIPFFVLMGNLAGVSGLSRNLYDAAYAWIGHRRGGLASATILGCTGFSALSGSSVASAVTMGQVALPEMRRYKYDEGFSAASVAAGGTLGILIPPSTGFVLYALLTEQSIGQLFVAGILPGILLMGLFLTTIAIVASLRPSVAPSGERLTSQERYSATMKALPFLLVVVGTVGGIYAGIFTPMESAAIGVVATLAIALWRRSLTPSNFSRIVRQTVSTTVMCYTIIIGANVLNPFLARSGLTSWVSETVLSLPMGATATLLLILAVFVLLGTFMEGFAMLVLLVPIFFPVIMALGVDPIFFGVLVVIALEIGLITPPVGINVFVVKALVPHVPSTRIFLGILPFVIAMLIGVGLLLLFPQIALFLPSTMFR
ncbi:TRAP transporter large permease [Pelagibacterium halotolerans]|uniref:TRAP transporter large permease protein n=1 Tax=Pelagibacterium halotolerans (strain DSM 22347 / JCM 15775 / CGMCC 1.7692 / B2) TaxID=1082931 RepID=G4RD74_PELHB|nr:TRAP transporter large permease [Pelagibacterium halotolerans]AEQ53824.1 TRAP dicarboxylate transporter, DctM subunit, unknown substrate 3 [Pelagibacterium halotolerans B2]QJR20025.1 TRAP transporter large permease [Pelagibacterium halotolerans]SEA81746.1 TRAP transporter, DctM subunit [Pelagibacterium halotolerans]